MTSDPIRLLDDPQTAASLRGDLAQANTATVEGLDHGAGLAGLQAAIAAETAATAGAAGVGVLGKIAIAVLLVGGGATALWATTRTSEAEPPVKAAATVSEEPAVARRAPDPEPAIVPAVEALPGATPEPTLEPTPEQDVTEVAPHTELEPRAQRPRGTRASKPTAPADAADRVLREARMIADAREALAAKPGVALALAQQAAREFPRGQLIEEREAIAIRALAKLGRTDGARARAERFLARYGTGPHAESVRHAIEAAGQ